MEVPDTSTLMEIRQLRLGYNKSGYTITENTILISITNVIMATYINACFPHSIFEIHDDPAATGTLRQGLYYLADDHRIIGGIASGHQHKRKWNL